MIAFKLIAEAQKYGARVALFGRKINNAENQLAFIRFLRMIVDGEISPEEAVRAYHGVLQEMKISPARSLEDDMQLQTGVMSYGGTGTTISISKSSPKPQKAETPVRPVVPAPVSVSSQEDNSGEPDFDRMTQAEKVDFNLRRFKPDFRVAGESTIGFPPLQN